MAGEQVVMVATDLSARSDRPFERAFLLADQLGASVLVLHVLETKQELTQEEDQRLRELVEEEFGATAANAEILFERGSVPSTISRVAEERGCGLIITGVARFNSPSDYVLGTAVDHLVRQSPVPVLVIKRRPRRPYRKLLVGIDFGEESRSALLRAAELFPEAELRLIHVYHSAYDAFLAHDTTAGHIRKEAEEKMDGFVGALPDELRQRVEPVLEEGHLPAVIDKMIREWRADLLVIGTDGGSALEHATLGSQAADLVDYEPCDVLTVRAEGA